jgi:hypothetical protein
MFQNKIQWRVLKGKEIDLYVRKTPNIAYLDDLQSTIQRGVRYMHTAF